MAGQVSYHPNADDYVAASRAAWARSVGRRRLWIRAAIGLAIVAFLAAAMAWLFDLADKPVFVAIMIGSYVLWIIICVGIGFLLLPRRARRLFRQQKSLDQDHLVSWNADGLSYRTPRAFSELPWSDYHGWYEGRTVFLFLLNEQLHHFVLKHALDEAQIDDLRDTAAPHFSR